MISAWRRHSNGGIVFSLLIMIIGLGLFSLGLSQLNKIYHLRHSYQQTSCTITQHVPYTFSKDTKRNEEASDWHFCPQAVVQFDVSSQRYSATVKLPCAKGISGQNLIFTQFAIGQTRACWFDTRDYSQVVLSKDQSIVSPLISMVIGLFLILFKVYRTYFPAPPKTFTKKPSEPPMQQTEVPAAPPTETQPPQKAFEKKNPIFKGIVPLLAASLVGGWAFYILQSEWKVNNKFEETLCKILDKKIDESKSSGERKTPTFLSKFQMQYRIGSYEYSEWNTAHIAQAWGGSKDAQATFDRFKIGQTYPCWYDPDNHQTVVLERGYGWEGILLTLFCIAILFSLVNIKIKR